MKTLTRAFVGGLVVAIFLSLWLASGFSESRKKKNLGTAYEGPLDGDDE